MTDVKKHGGWKDKNKQGIIHQEGILTRHEPKFRPGIIFQYLTIMTWCCDFVPYRDFEKCKQSSVLEPQVCYQDMYQDYHQAFDRFLLGLCFLQKSSKFSTSLLFIFSRCRTADKTLRCFTFFGDPTSWIFGLISVFLHHNVNEPIELIYL